MSTIGTSARSIAARLSDRVRPWRAGVAAPVAEDACVPGRPVIVVGAGAAGLATAAELGRLGARAVVLEASDRVGGSWGGRYDSLRLNSVRWMSDLAGRRLREGGRWVARDDVVRYLEHYATWHELDVRLGCPVTELQRDGCRWTLTTPAGSMDADAVVVATGAARVPKVPDWVRSGAGQPVAVHSSDYRNPSSLPAGGVVVVGGGSSGGEIAAELARAGRAVTWAVRGVPTIAPREAAGIVTTPLGLIGDHTPDRIVDVAAASLERALYGRRRRLPAPPAPVSERLARCKEPLTADGIVELVEEGRIDVVPAVAQLHHDGVGLVDGRRVRAEVVVAATGYEPALAALVGHLDVLDGNGRPVAPVPLPGLGFVGFRIALAGTLWAIDEDARRVARWLVGAPATAAADATISARGLAGR